MSSDPSPVRVGVLGAGGRMGTTVCEAVHAEPGLVLVAAVDPHHEGAEVGLTGLRIAGGCDALEASGATVAVDFTAADSARENLRWCAAHDVHAVVGTSGLGQADHDELRAAFTRSNVVVVPNFAIGAVLMMRFAELAAPWFDTAEIIELHHDAKIDAPSGTAVATATRMAAASPEWGADPTTRTVVEGARGGVGPGGIHVHSVRLRGLVAHQEVLLGAAGQTLTLRHDSYDRASFMPGVVLACKGIAGFPGLTIGLEPFLGL